MKKIIYIALLLFLMNKQCVIAQTQNLVDFKNEASAYSTIQDISSTYKLNVDLQKNKSREETAFILVNLMNQVKAENIILSSQDSATLAKLKVEYLPEIEKIQGGVITFNNDSTMLSGFVDKVKYYNSDEFKGKIFNKHFKVSIMSQTRFSTDINEGDEGYDRGFSQKLSGVAIKGEIVENFNYYINALFLKDFKKHTGGAIGDWFFTSTLIPNNTIKVGQFRTHMGIEGTKSSFSLDGLDRSLTARKLGNKRDNGIQVTGNYEYFDYIVGSYLGVGNEFQYKRNENLDYNGWLYLKPFGSDSKYGKLKLGSGIYTGNIKDVNYQVFGSALTYDYNKYSFITEYLYKDGYKAANRNAHGMYVANKYRITPKTELFARYDVFDANKGVSNTNTDEYTLGVNYYSNGKKFKHTLNYVYVVDDVKDNAARLSFQTQYIF